MTAAATVATAPLMAHHFDSFSLAALPANLLALPAVAPAMWLGMLAGIAGQLPAIPVEPVNWLNSLCLAYIAQIAHWLAHPRLVPAGDPARDAAGGRRRLPGSDRGESSCCSARRSAGPAWCCGGAGSSPLPARRRPRGRGWRCSPGSCSSGPSTETRADAGDLVVRVLDVGQGDSILLDPPGGDPVLIDTGPPGAGVAERLRELGVESLAAVVISHDQSDHAGGLGELLESLPVGAGRLRRRSIRGCGGWRWRRAPARCGWRRAASSTRERCG